MEIKQIRTDGEIDEVVARYSDMVYRLAFAQTKKKSDADDVYQEVFLRYIRKNPQFETEEHRKAWLIRVTINCCKTLWKSAWKRKVVPLEHHIPVEMELGNDLHHYLEKLPVKYRAVIHLFYYEDLSIETISHILNQKESTIRTQLTRARQKLKSVLGEDYDG